MALDIYDGYKLSHLCLPCPFCGEIQADGKPTEPAYMSQHKPGKNNPFGLHYTINCGNCGAEPNSHCETEMQAIERWNTRPVFSESAEFRLGFEEAKRQIVTITRNLKQES